MKVYALIETWESTEDWAGNDLLVITKDFGKAKKMMAERYANQIGVCDSYSDDDSYISDFDARVVDAEKDGSYYLRTYWNIVPYNIEE